MSEAPKVRGTAAPHVVQVPVDLVEFEARLIALERRVHEQEARDRLMLDVSAALRRLTNALGPLLEVVGPLAESPEALAVPPPAPPSRPEVPPPTAPTAVASPPTQGPAIEPERLAAAQARLREAAEAAQPPPVPPAMASPPVPPAMASPPAPPASARPPGPLGLLPGRRSWLLRALRRVAARDPESAGRLLLALLPASPLAQIGPAPQLPGPPGTVARIVVRGPLRRRLGWEMAQLACELSTVSALAKLARLRASPAQLQAAGVRLDSRLALALVANAIDPTWTLGHRFTLAHLDVGAAYLEVRNGLRPAVRDQAPAGPVHTTVRCSADALVSLLAGEAGVVATVEGERRPLKLVQDWFQHATSA